MGGTRDPHLNPPEMLFFLGKTQLFSPYSFPRVHHRGYGLVELLAGMLAATAFKADDWDKKMTLLGMP